MKILTLGKGFVSDHLPYEKYTKHLPIDDGMTFEERVINKYKPDVIVNCIGRTGRPNVDWCEANRAETYLTNTVMPGVLASMCELHSIQFIQLGSGCIFFGGSPNITNDCGCNFEEDCDCDYNLMDSGWKETDHANPKSYYSKSKYACDLMLGQMANVTTLRLRMPVSSKNDPRNFINKIRGYDQIIDIPNSMTMMDDLVRCVDWAAKERMTGIFHVTNPEPITAAQVMREYQKYVPDHKFTVIDEAQLDKLTIAKRSNCILDTTKLNDAGFHMTPSKEALEKCMAQYMLNL